MKQDETSARHTRRANVYRVLADCFHPPDRLQKEDLEFLLNQLEPENQACCPLAEELVRAFPADGDSLQALRVAHAKLFVGPFDLLAPPYGSVYLDHGRQVMGPSTMDALRCYQDAELDPSPDANEPPDHISSELEFMYYLGFRYLTTGKEGYLSMQRNFMENHLGRWLPDFAERICQGDTSLFYGKLASLTKAFVSEDRQLLTKVDPE